MSDVYTVYFCTQDLAWTQTQIHGKSGEENWKCLSLSTINNDEAQNRISSFKLRLLQELIPDAGFGHSQPIPDGKTTDTCLEV